jgi:hypothetical protein
MALSIQEYPPTFAQCVDTILLFSFIAVFQTLRLSSSKDCYPMTSWY